MAAERPYRVLFVCLGNICRSPAAEGVLRARMPEAVIDSAGTSDWHVGEAPYGAMSNAALERGIDISELRARPFCVQDFDRFDLILAMDDDNISGIESLRPTANKTPVKLFTDYAVDQAADFVPDPYYTRDFNGVLDLIEQCADGLQQALGRSAV